MDQQNLPHNKQILHPAALGWTGWKRILPRITHNLFAGSTTLMAAGCAFYSTLSLFPAISALISIYGLSFDVRTITPQMMVLQHLLPTPAFTLIQDRVQTLVNEPHTSLTFNLVISLIVALWSASAATRSVIYALNITYNTHETRNFVVFHIIAFFLTLAVVIGAVLTIALMVAAPLLFHMISELHIPVGIPIDALSLLRHLTHWTSFIVLFIFETLVLSGLYNFGPNRPRRTSWCWTMPGAILATLIWILTSQVFSYYVAHLADYDMTYGPLGTVIAIMMWFFVTAWVVLMGAEINANMENYALNNTLPNRIGYRP
ncbi:MAG: YihY/virulence factor BrkB family protein [Acetobacter sp.]|nr:YihY/virulence factor BrkB family protein [Acetobacter sp.]